MTRTLITINQNTDEIEEHIIRSTHNVSPYAILYDGTAVIMLPSSRHPFLRGEEVTVVFNGQKYQAVLV